MGIYLHLASQYHAWPSAARGITMLRVDDFPYLHLQTRDYQYPILFCLTLQSIHALTSTTEPLFNILRPRENGRHFADDIFKCIFLNENV